MYSDFGLSRSLSLQKGEDLTELVDDLLLSINVKPKFEAVRIGYGKKRPVKVTMQNTDAVFEVIKAAKGLKNNEEYCDVFITEDRTIEERESRKKLVLEMKEKISEDPSI